MNIRLTDQEWENFRENFESPIGRWPEYWKEGVSVMVMDEEWEKCAVYPGDYHISLDRAESIFADHNLKSILNGV